MVRGFVATLSLLMILGFVLFQCSPAEQRSTEIDPAVQGLFGIKVPVSMSDGVWFRVTDIDYPSSAMDPAIAVLGIVRCESGDGSLFSKEIYLGTADGPLWSGPCDLQWVWIVPRSGMGEKHTFVPLLYSR